jgi:glyoxylase-like metal-dependent hydrolase (beta-lactamase superfamily II)
MNLLEHELQYPFANQLPEGGHWLEVAPGIRWVRMPLPFALDHINLYLLADEIDGRQGWTLVDCGVASDAIRAHWEQIFATGLDGLPILRVLCTHTHPDHIGLAAWICARFAAPLWMTLGEYTFGRILSMKVQSSDVGPDDSASHYERHGLSDPAMLAALRTRNKEYFASLVPDMPRQFHRIRVDEPVRIGKDSWQVYIGTGHSPEHASLHCEARGLLLAGDMVLPRISTNVSVFEIEPEANSVQWFLDSLKAYAHLAADTLVLPSHGRPFTGMHRRIEQLTEHHNERLGVLLAACQGKATSAHDAMKVIFNRDFDLHQTTFAMGEALAHLHCLWYRGQLTRKVTANAVRFYSV